MSENVPPLPDGGGGVVIIVHAASPPEGAEYGTPPIVLSEEYDCPDCGRVHLLEKCPECGSTDIGYSFGLGGGPGYGPWKYCDCGWTWKHALPSGQE